MAQSQGPKTGEKRGPGRPPRTATTPAAKKQKTAAPTPPSLASPVTRSPAIDSPVPEKKVIKLPSKVADSKPLPTLSEPQSLDLSSDEYQTIAASKVLATALDRSRLKWISEGIFKRYWVKPEKGTGKNAKPQPPNNPELKWQKGKGECRIRLEPHLLVAQVFVEEKPRPKQTQPVYGQYGPQQYRPPQSQPYMQHPQHFANRALPPSHPGTPQPAPSSQSPLSQQSAQRTPAASSPAPGQQDKKANPDPVISMLASRASSNPELKALMKEVATGNATQDQLKVFQKHIDELTAIIAKQKDDGKDQTPQPNTVQYDGAADQRPQLQPQPRPQPIQPQQAPLRAPYVVPPPPMYPQPPPWTPPTNLPVILEFQTAGATEDRFLFPEYSILESLSPQHELVSFIVVRKGSEAADKSGLDPEKEYWQPVTMMVEVAYGREDIMSCIRRWVRPAGEVQKHMEDVMQRCHRAPESYLALRLPCKGAAATESEDVSKEATPVVIEDKVKPKAAGVKSTGKRAASSKLEAAGSAASLQVGEAVGGDSTSTPTSKQTPATTTQPTPTHAPIDGPSAAASKDTASTSDTATTSTPNATSATAATTPATATATSAATAAGEGASGPPAATESSRPRRAHRKSVRISEG